MDKYGRIDSRDSPGGRAEMMMETVRGGVGAWPVHWCVYRGIVVVVVVAGARCELWEVRRSLPCSIDGTCMVVNGVIVIAIVGSR